VIVPGDVGKLRSPCHVADGEDALGARLVVVAGHDETALVELDAGALAIEILGVRPPAGCEKQMTARDVSASLEPGDDAFCSSAHAFDSSTELDPHTLFREHGLDLARNLWIFAVHQVLVWLHDGHLGAEPTKHLSEFTADVATTDDDEVLGKLVEIHQPVIVEPRRRIEPGDLR
jgi:hypothetical protein